MASEVSIINEALLELGQKTIVARTDDSTEARTMDSLFDPTRDNLLRRHTWNFATKRIKLARSANTPAFEFSYQYPVPSDWLRTVVVSASDHGHTDIDYKQAYDATDGRVILSDATELWLAYVAETTDPGVFGPDFSRLLALDLAQRACIKLKNSRPLREDLATAYKNQWFAATSADAIEDMPDRRPEGSWVTGRRGGHQPSRYWPG